MLAALAGLPLHVSSQSNSPVPQPPVGLPPIVVSTPANTSADAEWFALKNQVRQNPSTPAGKNTAPAATTSAAAVAKLLDQANQLQDFRTKHPAHPAVKEAKQLEAVVLAFAALKGDMSQDQRRASLVEEVRIDQGLPVARRFEAVAWSKQVGIARQKPAARADFLAAHETAGRQLVSEFPAFPGGYESLLGVARDSAPDRGKVIARDLIGMAGAPAFVKDEANLLLGRFALIGRSFTSILATAGAAALPPNTQGKIVVIYAWRSDIMPYQALFAKAPTAAFIGINLDTNAALAKETVTKAKLPGDQYYDSRGATSPLAVALQLNRPPAVYLIDATGVICDVQGADAFAQKLSQLGR